MGNIETACREAIAKAKDIPVDSVTPDSTLEALQLDSLDRVSLSFDLEEKYGVEIPEHRLYSIETVNDLVNEIQAAIDRKNTPGTPEPQP